MAGLSSSQSPLRSFAFIPSAFSSSRPPRLEKPHFSSSAKAPFLGISEKVRVLRSTGGARGIRASHLTSKSDDGKNSIEEDERPPFDLNLAVVLAGFAFEAYTSPPKNVGWCEVDAADCQTVFLSELFLREVYDGQLYIKLKKGVDFPALDPWGTSDPYVIFQMDDQVAKSKVKWATKEPIWNEDLTFNIKIPPAKSLQVAAWDANLVTPHKRMGNTEVNLGSLCDGVMRFILLGDLHEVSVELEGIGGGGKIYFEVKYRSYDEIEKDKQWWRIPFVSDFLMKSSLGSALKVVLGSEGINVSQFVQSAFGQLKLSNYTHLLRPPPLDSNDDGPECSDKCSKTVSASEHILLQSSSSENCEYNPGPETENNVTLISNDANGSGSSLERKVETVSIDEYFWKSFADVINQNVVQKLGFSLPDVKMSDAFDLLNKVGLQSRRIAEKAYLEGGLATSEIRDANEKKTDLPSTSNSTLSSPLDIRKLSLDVLSQTETVFGALMVLTATLSQPRKDSPLEVEDESKTDVLRHSMNKEQGPSIQELAFDTQKAEDMRKLFSSAESAMEAWAMLATSLGRTSFIKSDFQKICFLDNMSTDTQVAIWRDYVRRRLVVAFRGTEQAKWKDLRTDLMLAPTGLNPERLGGDFKNEVQVHSGFLNAYDSVKNRIMKLIHLAIGYSEEDDLDCMPKWHVFVTGHSLGGALATLLALELSLSRMAKSGWISVTMYNFGSPRVGNKRFAELYNEKVKDSWRVVNHRDIIPTVPRLMGYCHVARPVYLSVGDLKEVDREFLGDGYASDLVGEATPDVIVSEFMKGEKQLMEKILQTEIDLLRSIRDGTALMQHMEDFYYITLLESVRSNYRSVDSPNSAEESCLSTI